MKSLNDTKSGKRLTDCSSLRVLNTILQQRALKRGCLVVRQSFFQNEPSNFLDLGGGVLACRGLFSSFKALQGGLYLNHDVSMTTIIHPGPVIDFLVKNQNVKSPSKINWKEAGRTLKNLRMKANHLHYKLKIIGLSEKSCKEQKGGASDSVRTIETTVYDYFVKTRGIELTVSADMPCINAGKPNNPTFFPIELCSLIPLQRYKKELNVYQVSAMVTKCKLKPEDMIKVLDNDVKRIMREDEPLLRSCGISINGSFAQAEGRILTAPRLKMGNGEDIVPRNGWWNIKDKKFVEPKRLENWAIVKFSTECNVKRMCDDLAKISSAKGMVINPPLCVIEENPKNKKKPPSVRVNMMFEQMHSKFRKKPPQFILCLLADKKYTELYGPWKRKTIIEFGILDQCIANSKIDEYYLLNILLKINAKLGGFNHTINSEFTRTIPLVSNIPTMILAMEVSHGRANAPSIASVVGSRGWPRISSYKVSLRAMPPKTHLIDSLFKPVSQHEDAGIIRELLLEFYSSSGHTKPAQLVIFRHGISTTQFADILNIEMDQILKACNFLEENWRPKLTVIVSQRRHHTKFFNATSGVNVTPGTIVDSKVCDLEYNNFYMCPHAARMGTLRPTHYHVLLNEIGFSSDELQELIHSLSYVFQRSNNAISEVAPVRYARLAAAKISQLVEHDKMLNAGFQLPKVHKNVSSSMFFI
ncbi:protein argonaute 4a [Phtheirospermum japonicum]|uniref:Protein argonaute 4a n=1 Tax=Phtheirospermum japonicum TaxID=374723 RepID=A0A830BLF1_9LAMI|nr:protein argonaute 4a [Phtheirospermum japonicum]